MVGTCLSAAEPRCLWACGLACLLTSVLVHVAVSSVLWAAVADLCFQLWVGVGCVCTRQCVLRVW
jgi:hypothetical protein